MYILTSSDLLFFVCLPVVYLHVYYCNRFEVWCSYLPPTEHTILKEYAENI